MIQMKKFKFLTHLSLLLALFSMSGCLHIIEEITIRKDGSGSYRFVVDASEIKKMVGDLGKKMAEPDTTITDVVLPENDSLVTPKKKEHELTAERLATFQGLSKVAAVNDTANYITGFSFDFDNVENLQSAMISVGTASSMGAWSESSDMNWSKKSLTRDSGGETFRDIIVQALQERGQDEGKDMSGAEGIMKMMMGSLSFKQVYHFPDQKIKKCNHPGGQISKDKHTITITEKPFSEKEDKKAPSKLMVRLK